MGLASANIIIVYSQNRIGKGSTAKQGEKKGSAAFLGGGSDFNHYLRRSQLTSRFENILQRCYESFSVFRGGAHGE